MTRTISKHSLLDHYSNSYLGNAGLLLEDDLGVAGDAGAELCRKTQGLVETVGVERLGPPKHRPHGLHHRPDNVVVRVLWTMIFT